MGGPSISRGDCIFQKYLVPPDRIFRNIWSGGTICGGDQICRDSSTAEQATTSTRKQKATALYMYMKEQQYSTASDEMIHCYLALMAAPRLFYPFICSREPTWHCYPCSTEQFLFKRLSFCAKRSHCFSGSPLSVCASTSTRSFRLWDAACSLRHSKHQLLRRRSIDVVW